MGSVDVATGQEVGTLLGTSDYEWRSGKNTTQKNLQKLKADSVARVAKNIGVNPNDLAAVISFETGVGLLTHQKKSNSSATGLIQFMKGSGGTKG